MTDKELHQPRFLVRQGCKAWMVYDRQRKGPALVGTTPAVNLTKEEADRIERTLTANCVQNREGSGHRPPAAWKALPSSASNSGQSSS